MEYRFWLENSRFFQSSPRLNPWRICSTQQSNYSPCLEPQEFPRASSPQSRNPWPTTILTPPSYSCSFPWWSYSLSSLWKNHNLKEIQTPKRTWPATFVFLRWKYSRVEGYVCMLAFLPFLTLFNFGKERGIWLCWLSGLWANLAWFRLKACPRSLGSFTSVTVATKGHSKLAWSYWLPIR